MCQRQEAGIGRFIHGKAKNILGLWRFSETMRSCVVLVRAVLRCCYRLVVPDSNNPGRNQMTIDELKLKAEHLEQRISCAKADTRIALQPQFSSVLKRLTSEGARVPARLRRLDAALVDEAVEAKFDNMPV
jgi:hypothetical protein